MMTNLLKFTRRAAIAAGASIFAFTALAQQYPTKPIRLVLGYGAGGGMDNMARLYGPKLSSILGVPVLIENRPGASEIIAAQNVMNSSADGYTFWVAAASALVQGPAVRTDLPYVTNKNFTPVALIGEAQAVLLVRNDFPVNNLRELITYAKASPGKVNYGSVGIGGGNHLMTEILMAKTGTVMTHIPFKSDLEVTTAMLSGHVDFAIAVAQNAVPMVTEGKLKPIAVTGPERIKAIPQVLTIAESGVPEIASNDPYTFYGLMAPAGTPAVVSTAAFSQYLDKEAAKWLVLRGTVKRAISSTMGDMGRVHALVCNAGVNLYKNVFEFTDEEWDWMIAVNLTGTWTYCRHLGEHMSKHGGGSIVIVSSNGAFTTSYMRAPYMASEGGVHNLSKALALDFAQYNIRVNNVAPGCTKTGMTRPDDPRPGYASEPMVAMLTPLHRYGKPEEVAAAIAFLASDEASYVNGASIVVDGGFAAGTPLGLPIRPIPEQGFEVPWLDRFDYVRNRA